MKSKLVDGKRQIAVHPIYADGRDMPVYVIIDDPEKLIPRRTAQEEKVQEIVEESEWGHVSTSDTPVRGLLQIIPSAFKKFMR